MLQVDAPEVEYFPGSQFVQLMAPTVAANFPAAQVWQPPASAQVWPIAQRQVRQLSCEMDVAPSTKLEGLSPTGHVLLQLG